MEKSRFLAKVAKDAAFTRHANAAVPARAAVPAGVEPYGGPWNRTQAMHLLRRTLFGFTKADLDKAMSLGAAAAVDALLDVPAEAPAPPLVVSTAETTIPVGTTWVDTPYIGDRNYERGRTLQSWWMGLILGQGFSLRERMTLFWHNHFATEWQDIGDSHHSYYHLARLRTACLGNFKNLARQITLDPAMLRYLNGNSNTKTNPNENYGRELQELFTIGKGPEVAPGNYTNYTEEDVKSAARVLTGWRDLRDKREPEFRPTQHDTGSKTFSSAYGGAVIAGRAGEDGALEVDDLLEIIFKQSETAKYLCRKLYRFFVYYVIDADTEKDVIVPMADLLMKGNWEVKPVVALLLKSAHFHHALNQGCFIKTPLDLVAGTFRSLGVTLPDAADPVKQYAVWRHLLDQAATMQMELLTPPNVAGWPAYYQDPFYYQSWISSDTLPRRIQFTDRCTPSKGYQAGSHYLPCDVIAVAKRASDPVDLQKFVEDMAEIFFPIAMTARQKEYLKSILLDGAPSYEWGDEWQAHIDAPDDAAKKAVVDVRLRALFKAMMAMAEYQLC